MIASRVILEPDRDGNVTRQWIEAGYVRHCHARAAAPANPRNTLARHADGSFGRGIQYPFVEPAPGEWPHPWSADALEPWKRVVRDLFAWRATHPDSRFDMVTCEFIPAIDYGAGAGYSILGQNVACASWLREEWRRARRS